MGPCGLQGAERRDLESDSASVAADLFHDRDTRRLAWRSRRVAGSLAEGLDPDDLMAALEALSRTAGAAPLGLAYGAGLEDRPVLLDAPYRRLT